MNENEIGKYASGGMMIMGIIAMLLFAIIEDRNTCLMVLGVFTAFEALVFVSNILVSERDSADDKSETIWRILSEHQKKKNSE